MYNSQNNNSLTFFINNKNLKNNQQKLNILSKNIKYIQFPNSISMPEFSSRYRPPIRFDKYFIYQKKNQIKIIQLVSKFFCFFCNN